MFLCFNNLFSYALGLSVCLSVYDFAGMVLTQFFVHFVSVCRMRLFIPVCVYMYIINIGQCMCTADYMNVALVYFGTCTTFLCTFKIF